MFRLWSPSHSLRGHHVGRQLSTGRSFFSSTPLFAAPPKSSPKSSSSSSSRLTRKRQQRRDSTKGESPPKTNTSPSMDLETEERSLSENDTRLAMRLLMQHHFFHQYNTRRPEEQRLEEERQQLREKHRARMERIEQKTRNSMQLGQSVRVDGILPLYQRPASEVASDWRRPNSVEAEAPWTALDAAGLLAAQPDTSVYSDAHDRRIHSATALDGERERRLEEWKGDGAAARLLSGEEVDKESGGLSARSVVQSQLLEDEDEDFAVQAYDAPGEE